MNLVESGRATALHSARAGLLSSGMERIGIRAITLIPGSVANLMARIV